mmetsp:Transcript_28709/g.66559  ORF Transcript_28709/g.66559 Transcript_28709/m.66559 type:complete len:537 (+) Transcript_28709:41-1651(+)
MSSGSSDDDPLAVALQRLVTAGKRRDEDQIGFVDELESAMDAFEIPVADRSYRDKFSRNYQHLFEDGQRSYRAEIVDAVLPLYENLYVNRRSFPIGRTALDKGFKFQKILIKFFILLDEEDAKAEVETVRPALAAVEQAWAQFEEHYINDLINIEAICRAPVEEAIALEAQLRLQEGPTEETEDHLMEAAERRKPTVRKWRRSSEEEAEEPEDECGTESRQAPRISRECARRPAEEHPRSWTPCGLRQLAASAASAGEPRQLVDKLAAKVSEVMVCCRGKGALKLTSNVLRAAAADFLACEALESSPAVAAKQALAQRVLRGFHNFRAYFVAMRGRLCEIDPQLQNNPRLNGFVLQWEDDWELGHRFLRPLEVQASFCEVCVRLAVLQRKLQPFADMVDMQTWELFMVLPRLVLFSALASRETKLAEKLLPSHFTQVKDDSWSLLQCFSRGTNTMQPSPALKELSGLARSLEGANSWEDLASDMISGPDSPDPARKAFLQELEKFSFEMSRERPHDWNRLCGLLLECAGAASSCME